MKITLCLTLFLFAFAAHANLDECLRDAKTHGSHTSSLSPAKECIDIIKSHPDKIEATSADGKYHLYGLGHMLYVESDGKLELLAGDQTGLKEILKIEINEKKKRLLVIQHQSVSTYNLEFIGNVSPLKHFSAPLFRSAKRVKLLDNEDMIAVFSNSGISILNADADTRYDQEKFKPRFLYKINGEQSLLNNPTDIVIDSEKQLIYVLDSERILLFPMHSPKLQAPSKLLAAQGIQKLELVQGQLFSISSKGIRLKAQ